MQDTARYTRVETRFARTAKELQDLAGLAERTKGNPEKLGAAVQQLIIYWSKAVRGEISIQAFCEIMGIPIPQQGIPGGAAQMPFPPQSYGAMGMYQPQVTSYPQPGQTIAMPGMVPGIPNGYDPQGEMYQEPQLPQEEAEDPENKRKEKERRQRNRNAAASEYA